MKTNHTIMSQCATTKKVYNPTIMVYSNFITYVIYFMVYNMFFAFGNILILELIEECALNQWQAILFFVAHLHVI